MIIKYYHNSKMNLQLEDFIPSYPTYDMDEFNVYNDTPENVFYRKGEFYTLEKEEKKVIGSPLQHQKNSATYLSPFTLNDEILLMDALGSGKCVHPDTHIHLDNNSIVKISDLWNGDITYRDNEGEWIKIDNKLISSIYHNVPVVSKINYIYRQHIHEPIYSVKLEDGSELTATGKHKLYSIQKEWITCRDIFYKLLKGSDVYVFINGGETKKVITVKQTIYKGYVYDLEVDTTHTYIANNIITHNTCSAITIAENASKFNPELNQALIIVKNDTIRKNFINELVYGPCIDDRYKPDNIKNLTKDERTRRINKLVKQKYLFTTFEVFASELSRYTDENIKKVFSNRVVIIDEAHNLRIQKKKENELDIYKQMHRFLHIITNRKIVLMTATPMRDRPEEFASLMNLILPLDKQLPIGKDFYDTYFRKNKLKKDMKQKLYNIIRGRIGYTRGTEGGVIKMFMGEVNKDMTDIRIYETKMSDTQTKNYRDVYIKDSGKNPDIDDNLFEDEELVEDEQGKTMGLYNMSRQASLFTFGVDNIKFTVKRGNQYILDEHIKKVLTHDDKGNKLTINGIIEKIREYSCIYAETIKQIIEHPNENVFIYNKYVHGAGAILFAELLKLVGFEHTRGNIDVQEGVLPQSRIPRFSLIIGESTSDAEIERVLNVYNKPENRYGQYIQVIIGSGVISEGRSLFNVRQIHIHTPHWNNTETEQAIGRGLRAFSHESLPPEERIVKIFRHASVPKDKKIKSINVLMYKISEDKDKLIKQLERFSKKASFNCGYNIKRNQLSTDVDDSRECDYTKCKYKCMEITASPTDPKILDTYNLIYAQDDINQIIQVIKNKFRFRFAYDISELLNGLVGKDNRPIPKLIVIRAVKEMIDKNIVIINRFGFPNYLREDHNLYFLVDNIKVPSQFPLSYYTKHPHINKKVSFQDMIKYAQYNFSLEDRAYVIENYEPEENKEIITKQLDGMIPEIQENFLENAVWGNKQYGDNHIRNVILDYYKNYIIKLPDKIVSTLLEDDDIYRCLDLNDNKWKECGDIKEKIEEIRQQEKINLENNPIGYYGMIGKDKKFRIKKILKQKEDDTRVVPKGAVCQEMNRLGNIIEIFLSINKDNFLIKLPPGIEIAMPEDKKSLFITEILQKLSQDNYYTRHKEKVKGKKTLVEVNKKLEVDKEDLLKMSDDQLKATYFWICKASKKLLCENLKYFFETNNLMLNE